MLQPETILANTYILEKPLGRGSMGEVWLAQHLLLNQPRAIKVMLGNFTAIPAARERFIQGEARNALRLVSHPNIVRIYELGLHEEQPFIVMEYVEGGPDGSNLRELLQVKGKLNLGEVGELLTALASALAVAHGQGLVHRDVKPANILLDKKGQPKLSDFGLTKDTQDDIELTGSGGYSMGTPTFMAPEQAQGQAQLASDIYSLGVVVYQMLTGRPPFLGTASELFLQHSNNAPPPLQNFNPAIPDAVNLVVLKALAKNPSERYPSALAMAEAYQQALRAEPGKPEGTTLAFIPPCPYQGLFAFQEEDAAFFFGREALADQLVQTLEQQPLVALVGPSGSGKSSLIYAGVIPRLKKMGDWLVVTFRPGEQPFQNLAVALIPLLEAQASETEQLILTRKLTQAWQGGELPLLDVAKHLQKKQPDRRLLLVADQFEELFTLCQDSAERQHFLDELLTLTSAQPGFSLIITLRADFFGYALSYRNLADALQKVQQNLGPMNLAELRVAIEKPAQRLGVRIEEGLTERILQVVSESSVNLPLLEFALTMLWDKQSQHTLTHAAYDAIGGVAHALAGYAEDVYDKLGKNEQKQTQRVMVQLVRPGEGTEDTRRVATRAELGDENWRLATRLANARLVVTGFNPATNSETVEVVHEALIDRWQRLREWLEADRSFRTWQERLRASSRQWQENQQDEGALLRGTPLMEAESWFQNRQSEISQIEQAYIQASLTLKIKEQQTRTRGRRFLVLGLSSGLVVAILLALLALSQGLQATEQRDIATEQRNTALVARATAVAEANVRATAVAESESLRRLAEKQRQLALSRQLAAQSFNRSNDQLDLALLLSVEANRTAETLEAKQSLSAVLSYNSPLTTFLHGHTSLVGSVVFSPDGKKLASADFEKNVIVWDLSITPPRPQMLDGHTAAVVSLAFSPDGKILASAGDDKIIILWNLTTTPPTAQTLAGHANTVRSVAFSPDGKTLASASDDKIIILWDLAKGQPSRTFPAHSAEINSLAFSPDSQTLATGSADKTIILWKISGGNPTPTRTLTAHTAAVNSLAFSPDGKQLASAGSDKAVILWSLTGAEPAPQTLVGHTADVRGLAFSLDGKQLVSAGADKNILIWDLANNPPSKTNLVSPFLLFAVAISPDGKRLASVGSSKDVILWSLNSSNLFSQSLAGHTATVNSVAISPDGKKLASASLDKTIKLWDLSGLNPAAKPQTLAGHSDEVRVVAFSPDGQKLASVSTDKNVILWNLSVNPPDSEVLSGHTAALYGLAFSPDGKRLASAGADKTIVVWDLSGAKPAIFKTLLGHTALINSVAFSPDGKFVAAGDDNKTIIVWDLATGQAIATLLGHSDSVNGVIFNPDGKRLASSSEDKTVVVWDLATRQPLSTLKGHSSGVYRVAFSPDGKQLASAGADKTIVLWDLGQPQSKVQAIIGYADTVNALAFSADGKQLFSASDDKVNILQDLNLSSWENRACQRANRNLTEEEWKQFLGDETYHRTCQNL